jgi:hypothetical protein
MIAGSTHGRHLAVTQCRQDARTAVLGASATFLLGGALGVVANTASPFRHGWWLVAYLSLVGGLAQLLLGAGPYVLSTRARRQAQQDSLLLLQLGLWSLGTVTVAAGELAEVRPILLVGSALLLIDLALFAVGLSRLRQRAARSAAAWELGYTLLLVFLAVSVLVGCALAGARPG